MKKSIKPPHRLRLRVLVPRRKMSKNTTEDNLQEPEEDFKSPFACKKLKEAHDQCFYKWYQEDFVKGTKTMGCQEEWTVYEECTKVFLI